MNMRVEYRHSSQVYDYVLTNIVDLGYPCY